MKYALIDEKDEVVRFKEFSEVPPVEERWILFDFPDEALPYEYYFDGTTCKVKGVLTYKVNKKLLLADTSDVVVITELPEGTQIGFDNLVVEDNYIEFITDTKGTYNITLEHKHFKPTVITLEAL